MAKRTSGAQAAGGVLGDSDLDLRGHGLTVLRAPPMWGPPTDPQPSSCPPFCSTTSGGLGRSPDCTPCLPAHPAWARVCPPAAAATREHPAHVGSPGLSPAQRVDGDPRVRAEGRDGLGTGSFHPSTWGRSPTGLPQILYTRSVLCVCVLCLCACKRASVDSPRNMHFGTRLVTSHTSFSLRPCFHLKR